MSKNWFVSKDLIFYLFWYNVIRWSSHIFKNSSFLSFCSFLVKFSNKHRGSEKVKVSKCDKVEWDAIMQVTYFLNGPMFNLYFIAILFYIERKWLFMRNLATVLPLKSKLSGKFQRFNAIDGSIKMLKNSWISKSFT